ncbi:MAG: flagellar hook-basal body complex protein [bacterium]
MLRSVYSGITGMRINQLWFDVIAGNMANVNTPGFKKSRISFEDLLNQTVSGAMQPTGELGGTNPMQIGLGSRVSVVQVVHSQGTVKETQISTDLLINGDGYFVVSDGTATKYTRAGNFTFDTSGNLINNSNGFKVLGWNAERDSITGQLVIDANNKTKIDTSSALKGIVIDTNDIMSPKVTSEISFSGNINSSTNTAFNSISLNLAKYIKSVVPVSEGGLGITLSNSWDTAGFENTPTGTITLGPEGYTQTFSLGSKPQDLIDAINNNSATTGISIEYSQEDKFVLKVDPDNLRIKEVGGKIVVSETPASGRTGFFTEAKIPTKTYHGSIDAKIEFDHLLDPTDPNNYYLRWKAIDPESSNVISTNAYYYTSDDYGVAPGQVTDELVGYSIGHTTGQDFTTNELVFELDNPDVDPTSLQLYVTDPTTGVETLYSQYKLPAQAGALNGQQLGFYAPPNNSYYFDDNGQTEIIYPYTGTNGDEGGDALNIGRSRNGVDRIIFITSGGTAGPPVVGSKITADYVRNGFNLSSSTVDPTTLQIKVDGATQDRANYTFNNNLGIGGKDQITFFSTTSTEEVVSNSLDVSQPFNRAGFNSATGLVMPNNALTSTITIAWSGGGETWTSAQLQSYGTVADFLAAVTAGVNGKAGTNLISLTYDPVSDRFELENTQGIYVSQSHEEGFLTHAKLPGEGDITSVYLAAYTNPKSREDVVVNSLDLNKIFPKAGFNNGFKDAEPPVPPTARTIQFTWTTSTGVAASWTSADLASYTSVANFIDDVNQAVDMTGGTTLPLGITLRYDSKNDRFTIMNTNSSVTVRQATLDGFLTKTKLLTTGLEAVDVPVSPVSCGGVTTANYNYNKTVEAKGILQLNSDYKAINNFKDTEAVPEVSSSIEVIDGAESVNLAGNWSQFDAGTINGTITIATDSGTYTSREINISNYPTVQSLLNEINASDAKIIIEYDPTTDKFTIKSRTEGARISLSETGTTPFFSEINITLGTVEGGNNNGVMDLITERPTPSDGWSDTTSAAGTGRDFIRLNATSNEVKAESLGTAGSGKPGTQVIKQPIDGDSTDNDPFSPLPSSGAEWTLSLPHGDVDSDTIAVYYADNATPDTPTMLSSSQVTFLDNTGTGGEDQIRITQVGGNPPNSNYIWVDYTRLNAFDLDNPDVDSTTLVLKVNGVIQDVSDFTFQDGSGANGVDRVILDRSYGTGRVEVDYRQVSPLSADVFVPNGNSGPEAIIFTPNTSIDTTYSGYKTSDTGSPVTTSVNSDYIYSVSKQIYDSLGKGWDITYKFEKLSTNRWLWNVLNPSSSDEKFSGYGIAVFDENGDYDKDNSKVFESPSDERTSGTKFKGLLFDPEGSDKGADSVEITADFTKIHQFSVDHSPNASKSNAQISSQDGYTTGKLESKSINSEGVIVGKYTNDQVQNLGQIALATFSNPSGLLKESATLFTETLNSGEALIGKPGESGRGKIQPNQLEMANVDLVEEFTDLIIAQRAFQANSRIIVTDDQILTEIVNMKR